MKKLIMGVLALLVPFALYADGPATITRSSFTQTNDTQVLITSPAYLTGVVIGGASVGGTLMIYGSTWTTTPVISSISLTTVGYRDFFDVRLPGLSYSTISNTAGVTILYKKD